MANETESWQTTVQRGPSTYVVQRSGSDLRIGQQAGDTVLWQDETFPVEQLPEGARAALNAGDAESADLQLALNGIVDTFAQRGG